MSLTILGGGPAGLSAGYFSRKNNLPFTIYEANSHVGGNAVTIKYKDFLFDSGAHRFHDKYPDITNEIQNLLGDQLNKINLPSHIYSEGKLIAFPLSPMNLLSNIGFLKFTRAGLEILASKISPNKPNGDFGSFALKTYGKTLANLFLINYSEKLWGLPCHQLSPNIAGKRMKGLTLKTALKEAFFGKKAATEHLDGSFYYPKKGIGMIAESLGQYCGNENICLGSRITKIFHDTKRLIEVEINGRERVKVNDVISTLPLPLFVTLMDPPPGQDILALSKKLRYRNVVLVCLFLNRDRVTQSGSVYFPGDHFQFTRVYEPKNRSIEMSPIGQTSLASEIPCDPDSPLWKMTDEALIESVKKHFLDIGWIKKEEVLDASAYRINHAYPKLELGFEECVAQLLAYLDSFENIKFAGRNGKFEYTHIHDLLQNGKSIIESYTDKSNTF